MNAQQLRNSILQQAIQGKLVPQDPADEPASVLLQRIRKEKERLVKEGKLKKKDLESKPIEENEIPFDVPESWEWVRLNSISKTITKGTTPRGGNVAYSSTGIGFLRAENVGGFDELDLSRLKFVTEEEHQGFLSRSKIEADDILITIAGTLGRTALVKEKHLPLNANQAVSIVRLVNSKLLSLMYLIYSLNEPSIQKVLTKQKKVTAIPNLTLEIISDCIIPLPPLAEQRRIVAKIEELMPLVERYGKAQQALDQLNESLPARLRQSILQEAIQGRLVPQDPKEEPASELLKRIRKEKEQLVKEGKLKKKDLESKPIEEDEIPFEIPNGWAFCRLGDLGDYRKGPFGSSLTKSMFVPKSETSVKVYEQKNAIQKDWRLGEYYISSAKYETMKSFTVLPGDIIVSCAGTIGETYYLPNDAVLGIINQALMRVKLFDNQMVLYWQLLFDYVMISNTKMKGNGSAIKNIPPFEILKNIVIPLPPLSEQKRIVAKVEELFGVMG